MNTEVEMSKKLSGYKQQDKKHEIYSTTFFVKKNDVLQLFAETSGKCTYCLETVKTVYSCKDPKQWTLDRIDNRMGHNRGNVVLSCLECNLKRGNVCSSEHFRFTKQLRVVCIDKPDLTWSAPARWSEIVKRTESMLDN
jgi:hypothetical protein